MPRISKILKKATNPLLNSRNKIFEEHSYSSVKISDRSKNNLKNQKVYVDEISVSDKLDEVTEELAPYEDNIVVLEDMLDTKSTQERSIMALENISNGEIIQEETITNGRFLLHKIQAWATECNMKHTDLTKLLKILKEEGCWNDSTDARSVLRTPTSSKAKYITEMTNGQYLHFDIETSLKTALNLLNSSNIKEVKISFCVDGTPTSASGGKSFWVILGCINNLQFKVFPVGIFYGTGKPDNFNIFLKTFVDEMTDLLNDGLVNNSNHYTITLHSFVCDAPAMALIKQIKSHGGYFCCQKCFVKGERVITKRGKTKIVYTEINAPLRTDANFRNRINFSGINDEEHHKKDHSILELLPINMVDQFILDKMHLVDEGVCKKLLQIWLRKRNLRTLSFSMVQQLDKRLENCYKYLCSDFQRKCRGTKFLSYMKASEFRVFLLYTGPISLKGILEPSLYKHFLCLSLAIRILSSSLYYRTFNEYAEDLLRYFVKHFSTLYGINNMTYNVHCLIHLAKDAYNLGPLDENSCYKFEAYIKTIKSYLHTSYRPLEQCFNRVNEINNIHNQTHTLSTTFLSKQIEGTDNYKLLKFPKFVVKANTLNDSYIMLTKNRNNYIIHVKKFKKHESSIIIFGQKLNHTKALNKEPIDLQEFFMVLGSFSKEIFKFEMNNVKGNILCKMCCLPYKNDLFFLSPINHTLESF